MSRTEHPQGQPRHTAAPVRTPEVARTRGELARALPRLRQGEGARRRTVAFVPTMGALHEGHRSLIRRARELGDAVVVSVFVNPLQFGPTEDLDRYPRTFEADLAMCAEEGVSLVFAPTTEVMYPHEPQVTVHAGPMGDVLEGAYRRGHFDGVLTVVAKLFNLVTPDVAVFGAKDAQQVALVRRMVADLDLPVHVVTAATVREPDGLARSSRNRYLTAAERPTALALSRALRAGADRSPAGPAAVRAAARAVLDEAASADPPLRLDYLALVDPATFVEVEDSYAGQATLAVAGRVGATRLLDNVTLTLSAEPSSRSASPA
ncbi:MAG: pantoate--beta-alanine ligase [Actinomycetes bacterium]